MDSNLVLGFLTLLGTVFTGYMMYRRAALPTVVETPEQKREREAKTESEAIGWYRNLLEDTQKRYDEIEQQNDTLKLRLKEETESHAIALSNSQAVMVKRQAEYDERVAVERNRRKKAEQEVTYYVLNRNELVKLLRRHAPNIPIPEVDMNGSTPS